MKHWIICIALMIPLCGCSSKKGIDGMPPLVPCQLTLMQGGAPAVGVVVIATSTTGNQSWALRGDSDQKGEVVMKTQEKFPGLPAGEYVFAFSKYKTVPDPKSPVGETSVSLIEKKFTKAETSPVKITIGTDPVKQTIDLGKPVEEK